MFYEDIDDKGRKIFVFECDRCGYKKIRKRHIYEDINEHFYDAIEVLCPRNICKEQHVRRIETNLILHRWPDYEWWETIETKHPQSQEELENTNKARKILAMGLQKLVDEGKMSKENAIKAWIKSVK